ncbi:MAG: zinc ribbon domain-containing protein [Candidatus Freyarchaeota archaeon]|nr:zinc ribbon domain-containing protein [Candidatus Jordarchaeia archaeon]
MRERRHSGVIVGRGSRIDVFADALDRELSFTRLKVKRMGAHEWRLRMGLGVKGILRLLRVGDDLHYELSLELSRIPLLLSLAIAAVSLLVSLIFFFFGFLFFFFLFPLVMGFWNVEKAEREALEALEAAQLHVFGEVRLQPPRDRTCTICGFELPEWAIYCPRCGAKL